MASYLRSLNPVPGFPEYTGPHKVGTIDVELPVSELEGPSPPPEGACETVQYRIFYPCEDQAKPGKSINWLPNPQRAHVAAYTRFLGAGNTLAEFIAFFPRLLYYISIPVRKNAPLLKPNTPDGRWPVMIFSHGLGGSRNAYSHLVGSIASHGMIVIAPEHRDRSTPISFVREVPASTTTGEKSAVRSAKRTISYNRISHTPSPEVEAGRTTQLKIRAYELGCIHHALLKMDRNSLLTNLNPNALNLATFASKMGLHEPGSITFAGHSFGAATVAQFVKTIYYSPENHTAPANYEPIFSPTARSEIVKQITPQTPVVLLDMWCLPLRAKTTKWLWNKPMPCYAESGPGGCGILAVESQAFVKWRVHLKASKRFLSCDPSRETTADDNDGGRAPVHFYYPTASAHLSQSDFGVLFPWVTKKMFASEEPERIMKLNVRAILQLLRERSIPIAPTSREDMELGSEIGEGEILKEDKGIFDQKTEIRGWNLLSTDAQDLSDVAFEEDSEVKAEETPQKAVIGGELDKATEGASETLEELTGTPGTVKA